MKIVQLNAENIKRLVAVEIRPDGTLVEITGKNGQGKTSILDAIWWALDTNKSVQSKPIRDGADSAFIKLDLGEYVVTKKFKLKPDGDCTISLTVQNKDGAKFGSPQDLLSSFIGDLTFDPLAFSRMKPREQVIALRALVPDYDFDDADQKNKKDFDDRTDVNRTARDLKARIDALQVPEDTPAERISADELMAELQQAMDHNAKIDEASSRIASIKQSIQSGERAIAGLREQVVDLQARIERFQNEIRETELRIEELRDQEDAITIGEKMDIEPIRLRVTDSEEINRRVERRKQREALLVELKSAEEKSDALTKAIEDRKAAATKAVRGAKLPVAGLELTEDAVLLNGQPFDQGSDAEQLRVSIAVAGAMNPKLRVIRVRDGSLLDPDSIIALTQYAEEHDLQCWVETVSSGRESAVVIEDGMVAGATAEAAE